MKIDLPDTTKPRIEMLPLIDVVFLVLVVFIYTMLSMAVHKGMPVDLPTSSGASIEKETILSVTIDKHNRIFVNKVMTDIVNLPSLLETQVQKENAKSVLLFADKSTNYQFLFKVLDSIRQTGLNQISLQADPESSTRSKPE